MWRRPRGQTALGLFGEQSFIFAQYLNTSFHNIQKTPLTRSGFETMFLHCIKSARFDARLHESPSNASILKYTFGCWCQWQEPNLTRPAVFRGENTGSSPNGGWIPRADQDSTGSVSDALIYNNSEIKQLADEEKTRFPAPDPLLSDYQDIPYFFFGDDAFALRETMMKPYIHRGLANEERIFKYSPAQGGWLKIPSESWRIASRFCWIPCSITPPLLKSSSNLALSCTIWWG